MWSVQTIEPGSDTPKMLKESSNLAPLIATWDKSKTLKDVISTIWSGETLMMFHIPKKLNTPELTKFFQTYNNVEL